MWSKVLNSLNNSSGSYSSEFITTIIRSQLVRLMAYTLHISMRQYQQSSLWGSWLIFFISQWDNINNLACEARGLYSSYSNKKMSTKLTSRPPGPRWAKLLTRNINISIGNLTGSETEKLTLRPQGPRRAKLLNRNINISIGGGGGSQNQEIYVNDRFYKIFNIKRYVYQEIFVLLK